MINANSILKNAESLPRVILFHDFDSLKPSNARNGHWLYRIKGVLLDNGYICHERRNRKRWGNCGYTGLHTHFHKPGTL